MYGGASDTHSRLISRFPAVREELRQPNNQDEGSDEELRKGNQVRVRVRVR